jgi:hypothetical protein
MFKFYFLCYKLQLFFKQYIHCITFTYCKGFMNFKQTLIFYKHKIEKIWKFECFLYVSNSTLSLLKIWVSKKLYYKNYRALCEK